MISRIHHCNNSMNYLLSSIFALCCPFSTQQTERCLKTQLRLPTDEYMPVSLRLTLPFYEPLTCEPCKPHSQMAFPGGSINRRGVTGRGRGVTTGRGRGEGCSFLCSCFSSIIREKQLGPTVATVCRAQPLLNLLELDSA